MTDFAKRVKDHEYSLDPIVRSLLDNDFYKMAMCQLIWKNHKGVNVVFAMKNRTKDVRLIDIISREDIIAQFEHVKKLSFTRGEITWLRGNTFYGRKTIFEPEFIEWLEKFELTDYTVERNEETGQFDIEFFGEWANCMMWEIFALTIINTLRNRALMKHLTAFQLDVMFARAKSKLWGKIEKLKTLENLRIADFGTRRRFDYLWQEWAVNAMKEGLGDRFTGTSNMLIAMRTDLEAIGTNAHELPMVYAALSKTDEDLLMSPYKVLEDWEKLYNGNMLIVLPDTFGTTSFLKNAPSWVSKWKGFRLDSKDNFEGGKELVDWWKSQGEDPSKHVVIHSDGLDVGTGNSEDIIEIQKRFEYQYAVGHGWGTKLTNDFVDCVPEHDPNFIKPISLVCKVKSVNGNPCVKLSDNWEKATGPEKEIARYKRVFGEAGHSEHEVLV